MKKITITDTTLRDGNHSVRHQYSKEDAAAIAAALDRAGVDIIEVGHGDGLTGSSINYGFGKENDFDIVSACAAAVKTAKIAVLTLPGIATVPDLKRARDCGASVLRVATHVTEADVSHEHIHAGKEMGFMVVGFLMMAHMASVDTIVEQAKKMESYGADVIYVTDSSGAMLPADVAAKVAALRKTLNVPIGSHSHNNLGLAIGNSLAAAENGATYIDGSLGGLGAGAGNTATEMLVAVLDKAGYEKNASLYPMIDAAVDVLNPIVQKYGVKQASIQDPMLLGYAGVYSSFMLHAKKASERFGVDYRDIIVEAGNRGAVGGQEDWLYDIAKKLSEK